MKIRNLFILSFMVVLGISSCTQDDLETSPKIEHDLILEENFETRNENECCDFTYTIDSTESFELCCINHFTIINLGDCPLTLHDGDLILALIPAFDTLNQSFFACESYADESGYVVLTISSDNDGENIECGTIPLSPDCSDLCTCDVSINKNGCTLTANIGDACQKPVSFLWTYPSGVTSTYWGITALFSGEYCLEITDENGCTAQDCITIDDCEDTEPDCGEDCVFTFQTTDMGKEVQFTYGIEFYHDCDDPQYVSAGGGGGAPTFFKNESGCTIQEVADAWNSFPGNPGVYDFSFPLSYYQNTVQSIVQSIAGCEDAQVTFVENNLGGIDYEIQYDCATCEIKHFEATEWAFDVSADCTGIDFPTEYNKEGGWTDCGACY